MAWVTRVPRGGGGLPLATTLATALLICFFLYSVMYVFMEFSLLCFVIEYQCTGHMGNVYIWETIHRYEYVQYTRTYVAKPYWTYA